MKICKKDFRAAVFFTGFLLLGMGSAWASEDFKITIKNHQFDPPELVVPTQKKLKIFIENQDSSAEKFYCYDLNREKVISGNDKAAIYIGPLKPGTYKYQGYYNSKTAQGAIVAKD